MTEPMTESATVAALWRQPEEERRLRLPVPQIHHLRAGDGLALRLVRYNGGGAGPVIFAHGNGTSNALALLDTIDTNLAEYLVARGHDLWLFDWRGSPDLDCPGYSLRDAAEHDWPEAVAYVLQATRSQQLDCVVLCAGGITLLMALAAGRLAGAVRSAVLLQSSLTFSVPALAKLKASVFLAEIVETLGWRTYRHDASQPSWPYAVLDALLKLHPVAHGEGCGSPSCQRMVFGYGPVVRHANISAASHARLPALLGASSLRSIRELAAALRKGSIVRLDERALDNLKLPLTFIHGGDNKLVLPDSARRLHALLSERHGPERYQAAIVPGYGHLDALAGDRAVQDVFPIVGAHLDRWACASADQRAAV